MGELDKGNGHFRPKSGLPRRYLIDRGIRKIASWLKNGGVDITLGSFHVPLIVQPSNNVAKHLASPLHKRIGLELCDRRVNVGIVGWLAAKIDTHIHHASDDIAGRKLRQSLGGGKKFIVEKLIRVESERSECPQPHTGNFEEITTRKVLIH